MFQPNPKHVALQRGGGGGGDTPRVLRFGAPAVPARRGGPQRRRGGGASDGGEAGEDAGPRGCGGFCGLP